MRCKLLMVLVALHSFPAAAQSPPGSEPSDVRAAREAARPLAKRGFLAFERQNYEAALRAFREAEATFHAPPHNLFIARALRALGRKLEARTVYRDIVDEKLASYAPVAFIDAQNEATAELGRLEGELAAIDVETALEATVTVDGDPAPSSPVFVLPGRHEVAARVPWAPAQSQSVRLEGGARETIRFDFPPRPEPAVAHPYLVPAIATLAFGGTALVVGTVTGGVHLAQVSDIRSRCIDDRCPAAEEDAARETTTIGHVSTAMFVVGGLAAATGTTLLIVGWPNDALGVQARLGLYPTGVSLGGHF